MTNHCTRLINLERTFENMMLYTEKKKRGLEGELTTLLDSRLATTKVDTPSERSMNGVIEHMISDIELNSKFISNLRVNMKKKIMKYYNTHLKGVELSQELKNIAAKYDIVHTGHHQISNEDKILEYTADLNEIEKQFDHVSEKLRHRLEKLNHQKQNLLSCRQEYVALNCLSLSEDVQNIDKDLSTINRKLIRVEFKTQNLRETIKSELVAYTKRNIPSSCWVFPITQIFEKYGIIVSTSLNKIRPPKLRSVNSCSKPITSIQDEVKPEVVESILVPENQGSSKTDCEIHWEKMESDFSKAKNKYKKYKDRLIKKHNAVRRKGCAGYGYVYHKLFSPEQKKKHINANIDNEMTAFKLHYRLMKLNHKLNMINYAEKNLHDDQFRATIIRNLKPDSTNSEITFSTKQIEDVNLLIKIEKKIENLRETVENGKLLLKSEQENENWNEVKVCKTMVLNGLLELEELSEKIINERHVYAEKYCSAELRKDFIKNANLPAVLDELIAVDGKLLSNHLNLLTQKFSEEFDQISKSIQSSSNPKKFPVFFKTSVNSTDNNDAAADEAIGSQT